MTIQEANDKAIAHGYEEGALMIEIFGPKAKQLSTLYSYLLDPIWWQALSKHFRAKCGEHTERGYCVNCDGKGYNDVWPWRLLWNALITHLQSGGSIESFFSSL